MKHHLIDVTVKILCGTKIQMTVDMNFVSSRNVYRFNLFWLKPVTYSVLTKKEDTLAYVLEFVCMKNSYVKKHKRDEKSLHS